MHIRAIFVCVLFLSTFLYPMLSFSKPSDVLGWQRLEWGDEIDKVKELLGPEVRQPSVNERNRFPNDESRKVTYVWANYKLSDLAFSNVDFNIYFFANQKNKLCRVVFLTNPENYVFNNDFQYIEKTLKKMYGTPSRSDDTSFENCLYYRRIWNFPSTNIELIYFYDKHAARFVGQSRLCLSTSKIFRTNIQIIYYKNEKNKSRESKNVRQAMERAKKAGKLTEGKFLYEMILSDESVYFGFNRSDLSNEARTVLNLYAQELKIQGKNIYVEIQGHTDNIGTDNYNYTLGLSRAERVMHYLRREHGIPLHRMNTISYGESMPVVDNEKPENRAKNRRVAIVVMR